MNPYTTRTSAQIQPHDMAKTLLADPFTAAAALATLERTRSYQAEAEVAQLLKQHGVQPYSALVWVAVVRRTLGAALVRGGQRLAATPARGASPATGLSNGKLRTTG